MDDKPDETACKPSSLWELPSPFDVLVGVLHIPCAAALFFAALTITGSLNTAFVAAAVGFLPTAYLCGWILKTVAKSFIRYMDGRYGHG